MTYYQDVADEIRQTIRSFEYNENKIKIWLGYIKKTDYERITKEIIMDIESLLICGMMLHIINRVKKIIQEGIT